MFPWLQAQSCGERTLLGSWVKLQNGPERCGTAIQCCTAVLLARHKETLIPCVLKARKKVCTDSKYQLSRECLLEKLSKFRSEFTFFPLYECCLIAVNSHNIKWILFSFG